MVDLEEVRSKIESYLSEVDSLLEKSYSDGKDDMRDLDTRIRNFIRMAFSDGEEKLEAYMRSVHFAVAVLGYEETEEEKQEDYISRLGKIRRHLRAYKEEVDLRLASREKEIRLTTIERETQISDAEARRRASVVDTKWMGAVIELLDFQRAELKRRDEMSQAIIELRKEVGDLKSMMGELVESLKRTSVGRPFEAGDSRESDN